MHKHNVKLINEYDQGEEGIDYIPGQIDPRYANIKKIKADIRADL